MKKLIIISGFIMLLFCIVVIPGIVFAQQNEQLEGDWKGAIVVQGQELKMIVHFELSDKNIYTGKIDIPQQGAANLPLQNLDFDKDQIAFELPAAVVAKFTGKLAGNKIEGEFKQGTVNATFYLEKSFEKKEEIRIDKKDQNESEIVLHSQTGDIYGSMKRPEEESEIVVLLIAGSGPTDRDGNSAIAGNNNSLKLISQGLADAGIASVRYDKRGIAGSVNAMKNESDLRFDDLINDAKAWVKKLKEDKGFNKVVILGHSQGSLVGMIAAREANADLFISIAGPAEPFSNLIMKQLTGAPQDLYNEAEAIVNSLKQGEVVESLNKDLFSIFRPSVQPFLISYMKYNPVDEIARLEIPVLIIQGTNDIQVDKSAAQLLKEANPQANLKLIEGMNHVLKDAPADVQGNIATYSMPDLSLADNLISDIVSFIKTNLKIDKKSI